MLIMSLFAASNLGYSSDKDCNSVAVMIDKYKKNSGEQLLEKGDAFLINNINDSAMICYSLIYNTTSKDVEHKQLECKALNKASILYYYHCDYKSSLKLLLRALSICEEINYVEYIGRIYNNIGNVHYQFNDYNSAKKYYELAYINTHDKYLSGIVLNNLGLLSHDENKLDIALSLYQKAYNIIRHDMKDSIYNEALNNIGLIHQELKNYDSAFFYYHSALKSANKLKENERKCASTIHNLGKLHFKLNNYDSAVYYLNLCNIVAEKHKLFNILSANYLFFSEIEESGGNMNLAFSYYKKYSAIKDSLFNAVKYATINELQFMYDMEKVDKHIKSLNIEQGIKDRTIMTQRRLQAVMGLVLLTVISFLIILYLKNKTLNRAYNVLALKNIEIVESGKLNEQLKMEYESRLQEQDIVIKKLRECNSMEPCNEVGENIIKYKNSSLKEDIKDKLLTAILVIMEDKAVFCDVDFTIDKLSKMVGSNSRYISQIINDSFKKNFRAFINDYRIKEARKILLDPSYHKYSIESIGCMVGFKSRRLFDITFKEITGITPSFYVKSIKDR